MSERWYEEQIDNLREEVADLQRQLDKVTRERDHLKKALALADALRNYERGLPV